MKTFEQFQNIDEKEKLFLELSHLDEIEIRFDLFKYKNDLFYFYKENYLFDQDKKYKYFYISYDNIWSVFELKFNLNYQEISDFMKGMVDKHFKLKGYTPVRVREPKV